MDITFSPALKTVSNFASEAHAKIQQDFSDLDPIIGLNQQMRKTGIPADILTIDCIRSNKRIIMILKDDQPDTLSYQFGLRNKDPEDVFKTMPISEISAETLYDWMAEYLKRGQIPT